MRMLYDVQVFFDFPDHLYGERRTAYYIVEAVTMSKAVRLADGLARRDWRVSARGGYVPRIQKIEERGSVDAR